MYGIRLTASNCSPQDSGNRRSVRDRFCRLPARLVAFGASINKDVVRRILAQHYRPNPSEGSPSWLTFVDQTRDSLWSIDLFRCESIVLRTYWVLVVMDQYTRHRIWNPTWRRRWPRTLSDVPASYSRFRSAEISQFRSRPALPFPSMGGKPQSPGRHGNQNGSIYSMVSSVR